MNLRDQILIDNQRTFLNPSEFADFYIIDGVEVKASLDSATDSKHPLAYAEGVSLVTDTLYVDVLELGYTPEQDSWMKINGKDFKVVRVGSEKGMLSLYLEANVS
ncbi:MULTISPECIES: hypothetical protein [unclassified Paenibacillus]|uniref:hypothetical protein n=1 Tax=unclassified Paenibacillus TaxID=185978 RepID=UPI002406F114|nr:MULTISPECIES: hypothetical protein [unclassified Paenibacillus]MDF9845581.1 hypothetical protein [Paenibacillus sp. PastF-2]MDF9858732.1 hypothetical protein [Paenibacillus sp. PastF-1]MDH6484000.1 hypothetical protein [Paenibacillus sp. PastH-2]MDH6511372.1 hypothetical protein [Paenibacillus sp. PastM-3]